MTTEDDSTTLVVKNTAEVWHLLEENDMTALVTDEQVDTMTISFDDQQERDDAIDLLSAADAWPTGKPPAKGQS